MEKKYICECHIKNARDKIDTLNGEVYVASNGFLRIDYPNKNGFFVSDFSLSINDIYQFEVSENGDLEIVCFPGTSSLSNVDDAYEKIGNYLYKFEIQLTNVEDLYEDIHDAKKKILDKHKKNLEEKINQNHKKLIGSSDKYIKISGLYGRTIPKNMAYTGVAYEGDKEEHLVIQFDNASEKKYLGQQFGNSIENTKIVIRYDDITDYYVKSKKIHIKIYNNEKYGGVIRDYSKENLLYFGNLIDDDIFEIILEGEEILKLKQILSKRVTLEDNKVTVEEKKENKIKRIKEEEKKYKKKSSTGLGIFMIFYILFYPFFWIISLPFMIISNFTGSYKKFSPSKTWNDWWNTKS